MVSVYFVFTPNTAVYNIPIGFKIFPVAICSREMTHLPRFRYSSFKFVLKLLHKVIHRFYLLPIAYLFCLNFEIKVPAACVT